MDERYVSEWHWGENLDQLIPKLKEGDLLEFTRGGYRHWAVYVGIDYGNIPMVIQRFSPGMRRERQAVVGMALNCIFRPQTKGKRIGIIDEAPLRHVMREKSVRINNILDKKWQPFDSKKIVKRARERIGVDCEYSIAMNNCEHFVNFCRYGSAESHQPAAAVVSGLAAVVGAVPATFSWVSRQLKPT